MGNRVGAQLPSGKSITYDYDALDALVQKSYSTGEADVLYSYSPDGNLVSMRDATGDSTYTYDANGRLVSYTNAFSATVSYAYNENGGISAITYPDGKTVGYEYDALGRMVKVTGRDGGETVYEYDAQGSVTQVARADGSVTTAEYDLAGRVVRLTNRDASGAVVSEFSYTYDATGYIATETVTQGERSAGRSYTYTQRGELATATENGQTVAYTYDGAGNRIKEEGPNGTTVFVYDEADRLQSTGGASVTAYTWDADGNMTSMESGEGVYEYIYDTESRLLAVREGGSLLMSVLYDGLGDRSYGLEFKMIDRHLNKFPHLPGYWNNGHWNCIPDAPEEPKNPKQANAAAENTPAEAEEGTGFWQGVVDWFTGLFGGGDEASGEASAYGVGNANGDYTNNGGADNDHGGNGNTNNGNGKPGNNGNGSGNNGNGNSKGDGGAISDWAVKKLKKLGFTDMDIEMLERLGVTDADARQIIETAKVPNTGNGPMHFIPAYDLMYYVNDVNRENTEVLTLGSRYNSDTAFVYGQQRLYADYEGESETYLYDGRGSVVQLLKDGAVTQEYAYDAYGYINADEFGIQAPFYGYNGEEQNPFTGLQYLRARYYAPQNGGFITQDSFSGVLDDALTQNRYTYAGNNPVNNIDPSGHRYVKGIEIGDNLKSSSAKKQPTTSGRPLSPGLTGAVVKKTTTSKKAPAISGSIAANAALSAARAGVPVGASSAVVNAIRQEPYVPWTNAAGQTLMLPGHFSDMQSAALQHILQRCDPNASHISAREDHSGSWAKLSLAALSSLASMSAGAHYMIPVILQAYDSVNAFKDVTQAGEADWLLSTVLGATPDSDNIYHIRQDWWQSWKPVGYNNIYDIVFDKATQKTGTSMAKNRYTFNVGEKTYAIWMWKGDYINLGAGAEAGIYEYAGLGHWFTATDMAMPMELSLTYKGDELYHYTPDEKQWWITGFDPSHQNVQKDEVTATVTLNFADNKSAWEQFRSEYDVPGSEWIFEENYLARITW